MIVFDLKCGAGHVFEAWFGSSGDYRDQLARGLVSCPLCGDGAIEKALMAPNIATGGNVQTARTAAPAGPDGVTPEVMKAAMAELAAMQKKALEGSTWVGNSFANRARAMHDGEEAHAPIHGQASPEDAKALIDDGVTVAPLPFPVVPPEACN
ncbi:MAG: DUF1178 family protein [Sphingomonas sp.]|uniref:DUF1178 family protein n=1 Tax=Sphingomonas sp. TaxID=28214 RepID=UPI003F7D07F7